MDQITPKEMGLSHKAVRRLSRARRLAKPHPFAYCVRLVIFLAVLAYWIIDINGYGYIVVELQRDEKTWSYLGALIALAIAIEATVADKSKSERMRRTSVAYSIFAVAGSMAGLVGFMRLGHVTLFQDATFVLSFFVVVLGLVVIVRWFDLFDPLP